MRFNYEDLKRGNVSQERIREIVQSVILKVDKSQFDPEVLERTRSSLIDILQKQFIFKRYDGAVPDPTHDRAEEQPQIDEKLFRIRLKRANLQLLITETTLQIQQDEMQKNALLNRIEQLEKDHREKVIDDANYQQRLLQANRELEQLQKLLDDRSKLLGDLNGLLKHRDGLVKGIRENEKDIQKAREKHAGNIIANADKIMIGDKKFFEGMSPQNIELFVHGRLAIIEAKAREIQDLKDWRDDRKQEILASMPAGMTTQFQKAKLFAQVDREFEAELKTVDKKEIDKIRELAQASGCKAIPADGTDEAVADAAAAYDNDKHVKAQQDAFRATVVEKLEDNSAKLKDISEDDSNINEVIATIEKKNKKLEQQQEENNNIDSRLDEPNRSDLYLFDLHEFEKLKSTPNIETFSLTKNGINSLDFSDEKILIRDSVNIDEKSNSRKRTHGS